MCNQLRCETCGATNLEKVLFQKPKRIVYLSVSSNLKQNTAGISEQEDICIDCFRKELKESTKSIKSRSERLVGYQPLEDMNVALKPPKGCTGGVYLG